MTANEIRDAIKSNVGNRTGGATGAINDAWYLTRANQAYRRLDGMQLRTPSGGRRILRFAELRDKLTRVVSANPTDNFLALQTDVRSIRAIYDADNGRPINQKSQRLLERKNDTDTGNIIMWSPYGKDGAEGYLFWKKPTVDVNLIEYVWKYPETLVAAGNGPVIDEAWHEAVVLLGSQDAAQKLNQFDRAAEMKQEAFDLISTLTTTTEDYSGGKRYFHVGTWRNC